jgi:hypothetical protein
LTSYQTNYLLKEGKEQPVLEREKVVGIQIGAEV